MIELVVVLACLALNALFSAVEMAFVSVNRTDLRKLADKGDHRAAMILRLRLHPERTLSVLQIGITLVGVISAAVGGAGADKFFTPIFESWGLSESLSEALSILFIVVPITVSSVVIGELVPKSIALRNSRKIILLSAQALFLFDRFLAPIVDIFERMTIALVRLFHRNPTMHRTDSNQEETSISIDSLSHSHKQFVLNLVNIESKKIKNIMVDWEFVVTVEVNQLVPEVLEKVVRSGHTRLPVVDDEEKVIGLLHTKEFITLVGSGDSDWSSIIRPILRMDQNDDALKGLRMMQDKRSHLALVCKSEDDILGIITMEDVLEEIIGEISDEDDDGLMKRLLSLRSRRPR